jgi:hypothetical protein
MKRVSDQKNKASQGHFNPKKMALTGQIIMSVAASILTSRHISSAFHMMPFGIISHILHKKLGLVKKLACRVSKLLSQEHDKVC